jgi:hypothetical protein
MTSDPPPSPSGGDLPSRHRPNLGNLAKTTTEADLWAFDDDLEPKLPEPGAGSAAEPSVPPDRISPRPREGDKAVIRPPIAQEPAERTSMNFNRLRPKAQPILVPADHTKPGREFDDLGDWEESAAVVPEAIVRLEEPEPAPVAVETPEPQAEEIATETRPAPPVSALRPRLGLTLVERMGLITLAVLLVGGGIAAYIVTVSRLPSGDSRLQADDFPVKGKFLTVVSADSFWREPTKEDTARRGTQLIPVAEFVTSGGPAALRVFFRDANGDLVGDGVTRLARPGETVRIAATAGFDDLGMHAAYRTDKKHPWIIEVYEAPSENSTAAEFQKLFEMKVAPDRR